MRKNLSLFCLMLAVMAAIMPAVAVGAKSTFTFRPQRTPGQTEQVVVKLEVGGETKFLDRDKPQREKMSVVCNLSYHEKTLDASRETDATRRSVRDYQKAAVTVKVGDGQFEPTLRPEHRLIAVEAGKQTTLLFSPAGNLTRDELDAIDIQANSLLLDRLLPEKPVAVGDSWPHSEQLLAALLGLDEVAKTGVESTLKEVTDSVARFEFAGSVEGAAYGVSTKIEIKGKYRFDLRSKRIDWLGMLVKEERESSFIEDGVDVVSRLQITITSAKEPASLADAALAKLTLKPTPEAKCLTYECSDGDWQCIYDRRWYIHHQRPKSTAAVLRLLDRGMYAGMCNLSSLPPRDPEKLISLEEFQDDVRQALGKAFGEFVEAGQSSNEANCRVYRVVAQGTSSEIPMRWIYYLVADRQGRQAAFTFAVEQELLERFADADKSMVQSLKFVEPKEKKERRGETESTEK